MQKISIKTIGLRIKFGRVMNDNMYQVELAKRMTDLSKIKITQQQVSQWENGTLEPSFEQINTLAEVLGVNIEWLLGLKPYI